MIDFIQLRGDLKEIHCKLGRWDEELRQSENLADRHLAEDYVYPAYTTVDELLDEVKNHGPSSK